MSTEKNTTTQICAEEKTESHKAKGAPVIHSTPVRSELIAARAYKLFSQRGCIHGFDLEDWLEAEKQLTDELLN